MSMSKKDFEVIASILNAMHKRTLTRREHTLLASVTIQMASHFRQGNVLFDQMRFTEAAGAMPYIDGSK